MDRSFIVYRIAKLDFNTTYRRFSSEGDKEREEEEDILGNKTLDCTF